MTQKINWHGEAGYLLTTADVEVVVLETGAKIASLVDRRSQREWLAQPGGATLRARDYGAAFTEAEMCGWDEMAPTIDPTAIDGHDLPDHGEVWAIDWQLTKAGSDDIQQSVLGRGLDYDLGRKISIAGSHVQLDYSVTGAFDTPFLWAAHPQFRVHQETDLIISTDIRESITTYGNGTVGRAALGDLGLGAARKTWLHVQGSKASATLREPDNSSLTVSWLPSELPYLGIWQDNQQFSREPVLAIEPSNGWYDDLAAASAANRCLKLGRPQSWRVTIELAGPTC